MLLRYYLCLMFLTFICFSTEKSLELDKPRYDKSRLLLRSRPASSLHINIRAVVIPSCYITIAFIFL
uniref:DUF7880 domain-containing protein n=1 Tax=Triticum urartu TaxID=4572 RepID=A0A8R7TI37_TRIUA